MAFLSACAERLDLGGGRFQNTHGLRPTAFLNAGSYQRINPNFVAGDVNFPHVVEAARLKMYTADDGLRRICPTGDPTIYWEIGAPFVKPAATWQKMAFGAATRTANKLTWSNANVDMSIVHAGHYVKLECALKGGYVPPNSQMAFPVGLSGLTRVGLQLFAGGVPVMSLSRPVVYDAANPRDVRPIATTFPNVSGQVYALYTLPSLAGMAQPVVDPTLTLQPDAAAGLDALIDVLAPNSNFGTDARLYAAGNAEIDRSFIQFDLSSIPGGSTVSSADLTLTYGGLSTDLPLTIDLHRVTRSWTEAGVTWNKYDGASNWTVAGGDYAATVYASQVFAATGDFAQSITTLVQGWVNSTWNNNGLMIKDRTEDLSGGHYITFYSSDYGTAASRPKLVVVYALAQTSDYASALLFGRRL